MFLLASHPIFTFMTELSLSYPIFMFGVLPLFLIFFAMQEPVGWITVIAYGVWAVVENTYGPFLITMVCISFIVGFIRTITGL